MCILEEYHYFNLCKWDIAMDTENPLTFALAIIKRLHKIDYDENNTFSIYIVN